MQQWRAEPNFDLSVTEHSGDACPWRGALNRHTVVNRCQRTGVTPGVNFHHNLAPTPYCAITTHNHHLGLGSLQK